MSDSKSRPMFRMQPDEAPVPWPVVITVPTADGPQQMQFTGRFRLLDDEETKTEAAKGDRSFIARVLVGWGDDVLSEFGTPLEFSDGTRDRLCDKPYFRRGVVNAYYRCAAGIVEKN